MIKNGLRITAVPLFADNYSYIVSTDKQKPLILVDPANPHVIADFVHKYCSHQVVGCILYTHKHWDHAGGAQTLLELLNQGQSIQVYAGEEDAEQIQTVTHKIEIDKEIKINDLKVMAYKVPCHTRGHVIYHFLNSADKEDNQQKNQQKQIKSNKTMQNKQSREFQSNQCAFTGDTLFSGGVGRFFEGDANEMYGNLQKINNNLSPKCDIFNGHEYTLQNLKWAIQVEPENTKIEQIIQKLQSEENHCSLPTNRLKELEINLFYRAANLNANNYGLSGVEYLRVLREAKNSNSSNLKEFIKL